MADIELVIKISEEHYKNIVKQVDKRDYPDMSIGKAIANGIVLPKGHGAIKDVSQIEIPMCEDRTYERWVQVAIDSAPTIIAEDKEQIDE